MSEICSNCGTNEGLGCKEHSLPESSAPLSKDQPSHIITCICGVSFRENDVDMLETHANCPRQRFINDKCPKCGNKDHYHVCIAPASLLAVSPELCKICGLERNKGQHWPLSGTDTNWHHFWPMSPQPDNLLNQEVLEKLKGAIREAKIHQESSQRKIRLQSDRPKHLGMHNNAETKAESTKEKVSPQLPSADQLGKCSTQSGNEPHTRCYECVDWKPVSRPNPEEWMKAAAAEIMAAAFKERTYQLPEKIVEILAKHSAALAAPGVPLVSDEHIEPTDNKVALAMRQLYCLKGAEFCREILKSGWREIWRLEHELARAGVPPERQDLKVNLICNGECTYGLPEHVCKRHGCVINSEYGENCEECKLKCSVLSQLILKQLAATNPVGSPAPTSECDCLKYWDSHHPECPTGLGAVGSPAEPLTAVYAVYNSGFFCDVFSARHDADRYAGEVLADSPEVEIKMMNLAPLMAEARTQSAGPRYEYFQCLDCGFSGPLTEEEIEKHRVEKKCSGTTVGCEEKI